MAHNQIATMLMFAGQAEEAIEFYTGLFDDSGVELIERYGPEYPGPPVRSSTPGSGSAESLSWPWTATSNSRSPLAPGDVVLRHLPGRGRGRPALRRALRGWQRDDGAQPLPVRDQVRVGAGPLRCLLATDVPIDDELGQTTVTAGYTIVRADPELTQALPAIERQAAARFEGWDVPQALMQVATPLAELRQAQAAGLLWVALDHARATPLDSPLSRRRAARPARSGRGPGASRRAVGDGERTPGCDPHDVSRRAVEPAFLRETRL